MNSVTNLGDILSKGQSSINFDDWDFNVFDLSDMQ